MWLWAIEGVQVMKYRFSRSPVSSCKSESNGSNRQRSTVVTLAVDD